MAFTKYISIISEIMEAKSLSPIERFLIRNRRDLYGFIANHFSAIIRASFITILIFAIFNDYIVIDSITKVFIIVTCVGFISLLTYKEGFKASVFLLMKLLKQIKNMVPQTIQQVKERINDISSIIIFSEPKKYYKSVTTIMIKIILYILLLIFILVFAPFPYIFTLFGFLLLLSLIIYINNDTVSFILGATIMYFANKYMPIDANYLIPIIFVLVFYIVDYYTRMHSKRFILIKIEEQYKEIVQGFELINTNTDYEIYKTNNQEEKDLFYVIDRKLNHLKIYKENSKFLELKISIENRLRNRRILSEDQTNL
jgi:hypothetical protein